MKKILHTPISDDAIMSLSSGDEFYITGTLVTGRDEVHAEWIKGFRPPMDLSGMALFHAGPIIRETVEGCELVVAGPTTSMRMERFEAQFIAESGIKLVIGKGGMGDATAIACREHKAVHALYPGGCAVLASRQIKGVEGVFLKELGMAEAMWILHVEEFGPLIVNIDAKGGNLFAARRADINTRTAAQKTGFRFDI